MGTDTLRIPAVFPLDLATALGGDPEQSRRVMLRARIAVRLHFRSASPHEDWLNEEETLMMLGLIEAPKPKREPKQVVNKERAQARNAPDKDKNPRLYWVRYPACVQCGSTTVERKETESGWLCTNTAMCLDRLSQGRTPEERRLKRLRRKSGGKSGNPTLRGQR